MGLLELGRLPTLHVVGKSIPQAWYRAIKAVWNDGALMPTEYDRRDASGNLLDPPGRDARVLIEVTDPFSQPRYPPLSFCEIGAYLAEIMGAKDRMVVPLEELLKTAHGQELSATEWPYTYHQRLFEHPDADGGIVNQIRLCVERVVQAPFTRRAVATTAVPNIDPYLKEDVPCLRELQLRCPEDKNGIWALNASTMWRSRDLYKAWGDNVLAITFLLQTIGQTIAEKARRLARVGSYADYSMSLHIYGQDFAKVGGDQAKGLQSFFDAFPTEDVFIARSLTSEMATEMLVLPQLEGLLKEQEIKQWKFTSKEIDLIKKLIARISDGELIA